MMGVKCRTLVLIFFIALIVATFAGVIRNVKAGENEQTFPDLFETEKEAINSGGEKVYLKDRGQESCIIVENGMHVFLITVYDKNPKGQYIKSNQLCIQSWYNMASIEYKEVFPDGKNLMFVKCEGNTGTGTLQMILLVIRWQNNDFVPIFCETISYEIGALGYKRQLKVSYDLEKVKTRQPSINLKYEFVVKNEGSGYPVDFKANWSDRLSWDENSGSFYNDENNRNMLEEVPFYVQQNIARVRQSLKSVKVSDFCDGFLEKTGIMDILDDKPLRVDGPDKITGVPRANAP